MKFFDHRIKIKLCNQIYIRRNRATIKYIKKREIYIKSLKKISKAEATQKKRKQSKISIVYKQNMKLACLSQLEEPLSARKGSRNLKSTVHRVNK